MVYNRNLEKLKLIKNKFNIYIINIYIIIKIS